MKKLIKVSILALIVYMSMNTVSAQAPVRTISDFTPQELVSYYAKEYNVSEARMTATIKCESSFNPNAIGDGGKSYGLSQIHLPSHPSVTIEEATTPQFAIEFMAQAFQKGQQRMWTCWRKLYQ
jgi:hypothetical protein